MEWMISGLLLQLLVLLSAGVLGCALAARFGAPRLVVCVLIGLMLGPTLLGRVAPDAYRYVFLGGYEQQQRLERFLERRADARADLVATGVTPVAVDIFDAQTRRRRKKLEQARAAAEARYAKLLLLLMLPAMGLVLLRVGLPPPAPPRPAREPGLLMSSGILSALVPGLVAAGAGWGLIASGWVHLPTHHEIPWLIGFALCCAAAAPPLAPPFSSPFREANRSRDTSHVALPRTEAHAAGVLNAMIVFTAAAALLSIMPLHSPPAPPLIRVGAVVGFVIITLMLAIAARWAPRAACPPVSSRRIGCTAVAVVLLAYLGWLVAAHPLAGPLLGVLLYGVALRWICPPRAKGARGLDRISRDLIEPLILAAIGLQLSLPADFDWLLFLLALTLVGDTKMITAALTDKMIGSRRWRDAVRFGARFTGGGEGRGAVVPLILVYLLHVSGAIGAEAYAAIVLAIVALVLLTPPFLHLIDSMNSHAPA